MNVKRAIEILNPEHRERYESIEPVNEACRMGMQALERQIPRKPVFGKSYADCDLYDCPACGVIELLMHGDNYCAMCGQAIDWSAEDV